MADGSVGEGMALPAGSAPAVTAVTDGAGLTAAPDTAPEYVDFDTDDFPGGLKACLEAILMSVEEPVGVEDLARVLVQPPQTIQQSLLDLRQDCADQGRGFELLGSARGWHFVSRADYEPVVAAFLTDKQASRLSQASLEALAIIAYKQPITRAGVSAVRGVNSDGVVRSLILRGLVEEARGSVAVTAAAGADSAGEEAETRARQLVTTALFLEKIGLDGLDELPALAPFLPDRAQAIEEGAATAFSEPDIAAEL